MMADQEIDREGYDLEYLYRGFDNHARIICYHGIDDEMIPLEEKSSFLDRVNGALLHTISNREVDGKTFKSTGHSLGADMLKVFGMALAELETEKKEKQVTNTFQETKIITSKYIYWIDRIQGVPILYREKYENK